MLKNAYGPRAAHDRRIEEAARYCDELSITAQELEDTADMLRTIEMEPAAAMSLMDSCDLRIDEMRTLHRQLVEIRIRIDAAAAYGG